MFFNKRPWEKDLDTQCYVIGSAIVKVATGEMPADFLDFTIDNHIVAIRGCYDEARAEGTEEKFNKSVRRFVKRGVDVTGSHAKVSSYAVKDKIEAVSDRVVRACISGGSSAAVGSAPSQSSALESTVTELDRDWFLRWADGMSERKGKAALFAALEVDSEPEALEQLWIKAILIIDHDCRDYVQKYLDGQALSRYADYFTSDDATPWGLVSVVCGLNQGSLDEWRTFIVDDMKGKLGRFADIMVDPSIVD